MDKMNEEVRERSVGSNLKLIIGFVIGLLIGYFVGAKGYIHLEPEAEQSVEEVATMQEEEPVVVPVQKPSPKPAPKQSANTDTNQKAVSLISYSHDWVESDAQISVRNNTNRDITSITGRIIYYDMSGNMLDYQDFTKKLDIEAGMTKRFELEGYNHEESYAYYKSDVRSSLPNRKYKVEFQLKSYTYK